jgi:hypothetical protein
MCPMALPSGRHALVDVGGMHRCAGEDVPFVSPVGMKALKASLERSDTDLTTPEVPDSLGRGVRVNPAAPPERRLRRA